MYFPDSYYNVLGAVQKYAEENGVYHKHHTQPGFYELCKSVWDEEQHWSVGRFRSLSMVNRFLCCTTKREYNVAIHSYNVAVLCMILLDEIGVTGPDIPNELRVDIYERALLHDCTESISMDIPYHVKKNFEEDIDDLVNSNINLLNLGTELTTIAVLPDGDGFTNFFVRVVDTMELALFCLEEQLLGNTVLDHGRRVLDICMDIIESDYSNRLKSDYKDTDFEEVASGLKDLLFDFSKFIDKQNERLLCSINTNRCAN